MFDSPFSFCAVCQEIVLLDQTRRECAAESKCLGDESCPLQCCFSGHDFSGNDRTRQEQDDL